MTEANDIVTIDLTKWETAEGLFTQLNWYYGNERTALHELNDAYMTTVVESRVRSRRVPFDNLKTFLGSDSAVEEKVRDYEAGLVTEDELNAFIEKTSALWGWENPPEYCLTHPLKPGETAWFLIRDIRSGLCVTYFLIEAARERWSWMRPIQEEPETDDEEAVRRTVGAPRTVSLVIEDRLIAAVNSGETTREKLALMHGKRIMTLCNMTADPTTCERGKKAALERLARN